MMSHLDTYLAQNVPSPSSKRNKNQGMEYEALRIASFDRWPNWAPKRPCDLAPNGFYYSGKEDSVVCFCCGARISKWKADDIVVDKHRQVNAQCSFVKGEPTRNVPLIGTDITTTHGSVYNGSGPSYDAENPLETKEQENYISASTSSSQNAKLNRKRNKNRPEKLIAISTNRSGPSEMESQGNVGTIHEVDDLLEYMRSLDSNRPLPNMPKAGTSSSTSTTTTTTSNRSVVGEDISPAQELGTGPIEVLDENFLKHEMYRLRTFAGKWSDDYYVSPSDLARAGFYYSGEPDQVTCAFCKGRLKNWTPTDIPMAEHLRCYPQCRFVKGENVGNVSIEQSEPRVQLPKKMKDKTETPSQRLGIITGRARHPQHALESSRLETFKTWPKNHVIPANILAKAGFIYNGYSDNVKCFYCDGGLRNWEVTDDPWREHARWFAKCGFLKLQKGEDYVREVLSETAAAGNCEHETLQRTPDPELTNSMDTPMVRAVVNMGRSVDLVREVMEKNRRSSGQNFTEASQLFEAVVAEEQRREAAKQKGDQQVTDQAKSSEQSTNVQSPRRQKGKGKSSAENSPKRSEGAKPKQKAESSEAGRADSVEKSLEDIDLDANPEVQVLLREFQRIRDERMCKVCMDEDCTVVFLPCGHLVCCSNCAPALRNCPICRNLIKGSVRVFNT